MDACPEYSAAALEGANAAGGGPSDAAAMPWTGLAMGHVDVEAVAALGRPRVIGVVGLTHSAKTTLLATLFNELRRGAHVADAQFAGSFTLQGWHMIARHLNWPPHGSGGFLPHTTTANDRVASLLHLAMSPSVGVVRDLLLSDMPGEAFRHWAYDAGSTEAAAAAWIGDRADVTLLLADAEALAGDRRGLAREEFASLAHRLAASPAGRRVVVPIVTKSDVDMPDASAQTVDDTCERLFGAPAARVTIRRENGRSVADAWAVALTVAMEPRRRPFDIRPEPPRYLVAAQARRTR